MLYIYWNYLLDIMMKLLQENIDTVTGERVENVGEEDSMNIKTEQDYMQLVRAVKSEEEVSVVCVFCDGDLFTSVHACVLYTILIMHSCHTYTVRCISCRIDFLKITTRAIYRPTY